MNTIIVKKKGIWRRSQNYVKYQKDLLVNFLKSPKPLMDKG